jgi:isopentenyl-diphosphate Delta-isomerase
MSGRKEPIILVDEQDTQLEIVERPTVENDASKIIRYVYVLLFNDIGQLLLQERASTLSRFPSHWDVSASGAVWPEEGYQQAADRKLPDELNMKVPLFHEHKSLLSIPAKASRMTALFVGFVPELDLVQPNAEKVADVRWVEPEEALKGYLLTPSCKETLEWWQDHKAEIIENVKSQQM